MALFGGMSSPHISRQSVIPLADFDVGKMETAESSKRLQETD